jgi:hypothetical protein
MQQAQRMNGLVGIIFLIALVYVWSGMKREEQVVPAPILEQAKPKPPRLKPHEPHPDDSANMAQARAYYASTCVPEPIGITQEMCDGFLLEVNKVDFLKSVSDLISTLTKER